MSVALLSLLAILNGVGGGLHLSELTERDEKV